MLSLPPVDDPVRKVLDARVLHFLTLVALANIAVAVGVAMELVELVHRLVAWLKKGIRKERERIELKEVAEVFPTGELIRSPQSQFEEPGWVKGLVQFGLILVVAGLVGEWRWGARLEDAHNAVHLYDLAKIAAAEEEAGDAALSASKAHKEADAVDAKARVLSTRIKQETAQLDAITPRGVILRSSEEDIRKAVAAFSGQMFITRICGIPGADVQALEKVGAEEALVEVLTKSTDDGRRWTHWGKGSGYWEGCSFKRQEGIVVFVNSDGPTKTIEAARALSKELASVLPPQQRNFLEENDTKSWLSDDDLFPGTQIAKRPEAIAVLIGAMPLARGAKGRRLENR